MRLELRQMEASMIIEVEGLSCAGKTTQAKILETFFNSMGYSVTIANEPGMTVFGTHLGKVIHSDMPRDSLAEALALLSMEAQLYSEIIMPELVLPNHIILRDGGRGTLLSYLYTNTSLSIESLTRLINSATRNTRMTISIFIDVPPEIALRRLAESSPKRSRSKFDERPKELLKRQRDVLRMLSENHTDWIVVNGVCSPNDVFRQIQHKIKTVTLVS